MLIVNGTLIKSCPKGENAAEQHKTGTKKTQTNQGPRRDPVYECRYVDGKPWGNLQEVTAPIDLRPGDELYCNAEDGTALRVVRDDIVIWPPSERGNAAPGLPAAEAEAEEVVEEVAPAPAPKTRRKAAARPR